MLGPIPLALLAAEVEGLPNHAVDPSVPGTVAESWWWGADIVVTAGEPASLATARRAR